MKILLGITGSIAAYKSPLIVRELIRQGAEVKVVMSESSKTIVQPFVLQNLSKSPVVGDMFEQSVQGDGSWHVHLARWCDAMLIAPCSATTVGKIAAGICDSPVTLCAMSLPHQTPLFLSPAMDSEMWEHPATRRNCEIVQRDGAVIIPPESGELASGLWGTGRMPEPSVIVRTVLNGLTLTENDETRKFWNGKTVLITAGPTREKIDDVRFISNYSSGKMGYAITTAAQRYGANVVLISGPVALSAPNAVDLVLVETAHEMYDAVHHYRAKADVLIFSAAVADFTPEYQTGKIKKQQTGTETILKLHQTKDILASVGAVKQAGQIVVGFALEAENHEQYAIKKLHEKNCDFLVLNAANKQQSGFGGDDNTISIFRADGSKREFPPKSKIECAHDIVEYIAEVSSK